MPILEYRAQEFETTHERQVIDDFVAKSVGLDETQSDIPLMRRVTRAFRRDGQSCVAEFAMRDKCEIRAIHSAAERNEAGLHISQNCGQRSLLVL